MSLRRAARGRRARKGGQRGDGGSVCAPLWCSTTRRTVSRSNRSIYAAVGGAANKSSLSARPPLLVSMELRTASLNIYGHCGNLAAARAVIASISGAAQQRVPRAVPRALCRVLRWRVCGTARRCAVAHGADERLIRDGASSDILCERCAACAASGGGAWTCAWEMNWLFI